jgi:thioredoxin reductase (NADPH)
MTADAGAPDRILDCVIIGGGAAGLTAATYLGRFRRRFALIDAGRSRLKRIPRSRNLPGFPDGIEGPALYERMLQQAALYGALMVQGEVTRLERDNDCFRVHTNAPTFLARTIIIATGVAVTDPVLPELDSAIKAGAIRYCPICDGFEARGRRVAVLGGRPGSIEEAFFLRTYVEHVTFLPARPGVVVDDNEREEARACSITVETAPVQHLQHNESGISVRMADGRDLMFDVVYPCLGSEPRSRLLTALGGITSEGGGILTDRHQETSIPGIFAAGDVMDGLDQIAPACGQAAIASTAIHNRLRDSERARARLGRGNVD